MVQPPAHASFLSLASATFKLWPCKSLPRHFIHPVFLFWTLGLKNVVRVESCRLWDRSQSGSDLRNGACQAAHCLLSSRLTVMIFHELLSRLISKVVPSFFCLLPSPGHRPSANGHLRGFGKGVGGETGPVQRRALFREPPEQDHDLDRYIAATS